VFKELPTQRRYRKGRKAERKQATSKSRTGGTEIASFTSKWVREGESSPLPLSPLACSFGTMTYLYSIQTVCG